MGVGDPKVRNLQDCTVFRCKNSTDSPAHYLGTAKIKKDMGVGEMAQYSLLLQDLGLVPRPYPLVTSMSSCTHVVHINSCMLSCTHINKN